MSKHRMEAVLSVNALRVAVLETGLMRVLSCRYGGKEYLSAPLPLAEPIGALAVAPNHQWLAVGMGETVQLYSLPHLVLMHTVVLEGDVHAISVGPASETIAIAVGLQGSYQTHGNLFLLDLQTLDIRRLLDADREVLDCVFIDHTRIRFILGQCHEPDSQYEEGVARLSALPLPLSECRLRPLTSCERNVLDSRPEPSSTTSYVPASASAGW